MFQVLNLPDIPFELLDTWTANFDLVEPKVQYETYNWTDSHCDAINQWCQEFVCATGYFAVQYITGNVPPHADIGTESKLMYVFDTGGSQVKTLFYVDDHAHETIIPAFKWVLFDASVTHAVVGVEPGRVRKAVTARMFPANQGQS